MWDEYMLWMYERNAEKDKLSPECLKMIAILYKTIDWVGFFSASSISGKVKECMIVTLIKVFHYIQ